MKPQIRGYARGSRRYSLKSQIKALEAAGCAEIYVDDEIDECIRSLIGGIGDTLAVTHADRLNNRTTGVHAIGQKLFEKGVTLWEVEPDLRHAPECIPSFLSGLQAAVTLGNDRRRWTSEEASEAAKKKHGKGDQLAMNKARAIWSDTAAYPTVDEALAQMHGWSKRQAYRVFNARGTAVRPKR